VAFTVSLFELDLPADEIAALGDLLDAGEGARAAAFRFEGDRNRYIARHGLVRKELAHRIGCAPEEVSIVLDGNGKPYLPDAPHLRFSLSHSDGRSLLAVSEGAAIGCDIERLKPEHAQLGVAARFFAPEEVAALKALPSDQWTQGFFNCWTRKEAYVKALGLGLAYPLERFAVTVSPAEPARLLRGEHPCAIAVIDAGSGYCAAVVTLDVAV
jgi:4'-phosphopantetheinyl transferase